MVNILANQNIDYAVTSRRKAFLISTPQLRVKPVAVRPVPPRKLLQFGTVARRALPGLPRALGGSVEHTPIVILVPPTRRVRIVRSWLAFRDHKHGKDRALRDAEARLAQLLEGVEA